MSSKNTVSGKVVLENEGEIKAFPGKQQLREFLTIGWVLKIALQDEVKGWEIAAQRRIWMNISFSSKGEYMEKYRNMYYCNFGPKNWRTLKACYLVNEANLKRLHNILFQLYDILEKAKPRTQ